MAPLLIVVRSKLGELSFQIDRAPKENVVEALGIPSDAISTDRNIAVVNAGLETLLVPLRSLEDCLRVTPDIRVLRSYCETRNVEIVLIYTDEVTDPVNRYHSRVFPPRFGYLEDMATGSGNDPMGVRLKTQAMLVRRSKSAVYHSRASMRPR